MNTNVIDGSSLKKKVLHWADHFLGKTISLIATGWYNSSEPQLVFGSFHR